MNKPNHEYSLESSTKSEHNECTRCKKEQDHLDEQQFCDSCKQFINDLLNFKIDVETTRDDYDDYVVGFLIGTEFSKKRSEMHTYKDDWDNFAPICNYKVIPYNRFKNVEFIAEGGFSKVYKAICNEEERECEGKNSKMTVALKELNNSENINSKDLNELKIFRYFKIANCINKYYGITQNPVTKNYMIITKYYELGDLTNYITKEFFDVSWYKKLCILKDIITGLENMHYKNIVHKDFHSGNILLSERDYAVIADLGISKSAIDDDDSDEIYGVIPYVAPEIFQGQKYTKASDIYSFGMIMWELMTGRKPFWDQTHDADLIIEICDGLRPPIVTNAPDGYIELMQKCWHSDPDERPTSGDLYDIFDIFNGKLSCNNENFNPTMIVKSLGIGPITTNNPDATYKSRPLSAMIKSAESTRRLTSGINKRKFDDDLIGDNRNEDEITKKNRLNENDDNLYYLTKELVFDINNPNKSNINGYFTKELDFDI